VDRRSRPPERQAVDVGGPPDVQSFQDALEIVKSDGTVHLIGLYHG
jgi:hypothetical protein